MKIDVGDLFINWCVGGNGIFICVDSWDVYCVWIVWKLCVWVVFIVLSKGVWVCCCGVVCGIDDCFWWIENGNVDFICLCR